MYKIYSTSYLPFVAVACICFLFSACQQQNTPTNDLNRMNLKGAVKQIDWKIFNSYQKFQSDKVSQYTSTRFNTKGLIDRMATILNKNQTKWSNYHYQNDSIWIVEELEVSKNNFQPQTYWLYILDEYGAQQSITSILIDSSINFHIDIQYNAAGDATEISYSKVKYKDRMPCKIVKKYSQQHVLEEEWTYGYDNLKQQCKEQAIISKFKVNEHNDIEREFVYNLQGEQTDVVSYRYKYDEKGNWTYKIKYIGDTGSAVETRDITYY